MTTLSDDEARAFLNEFVCIYRNFHPQFPIPTKEIEMLNFLQLWEDFTISVLNLATFHPEFIPKPRCLLQLGLRLQEITSRWGHLITEQSTLHRFINWCYRTHAIKEKLI